MKRERVPQLVEQGTAARRPIALAALAALLLLSIAQLVARLLSPDAAVGRERTGDAWSSVAWTLAIAAAYALAVLLADRIAVRRRSLPYLAIFLPALVGVTLVLTLILNLALLPTGSLIDGWIAMVWIAPLLLLGLTVAEFLRWQLRRHGWLVWLSIAVIVAAWIATFALAAN